jgi:hypothetical protein
MRKHGSPREFPHAMNARKRDLLGGVGCSIVSSLDTPAQTMPPAISAGDLSFCAATKIVRQEAEFDGSVRVTVQPRASTLKIFSLNLYGVPRDGAVPVLGCG